MEGRGSATVPAGNGPSGAAPSPLIVYRFVTALPSAMERVRNSTAVIFGVDPRSRVMNPRSPSPLVAHSVLVFPSTAFGAANAFENSELTSITEAPRDVLARG